MTVSTRFMAKLQQTKDALGHSHPNASTEQVLEACMDLMLATKRKQKAALAEKPLATPRPSRREAIPAHVKRAVWRRADGRCEWRFEDGGRCGSSTRLEFDHLEPVALGGVAAVETIRLACRAHNQLAARRVFGDALMDRFTRRRRERALPGATCSGPVDVGSLWEHRDAGG
jgi:hypothetical protein